jgi:epoxyqueuosine reductase
MQFTYRNPDRSTDPRRTLASAASVVVGAWCYLEQEPEHPSSPKGRPHGRVARYAWRDHYVELRLALGQVGQVLVAEGWTARVVADDNALVDRAAAVRAGLGWFGKNSNVLLPGQGSWFVLGSVVTDAPLAPDEPVAEGCGPCRRCSSSCPTGALVAPGVLDARRCLAWLLQAPGVFPPEHRVALGDRMYGCDDCQVVCPPNRLAAARTRPGPHVPELQNAVDLIEVLTEPDGELLRRYGRWYIPQRDPRYLRRNALVALGNAADGRAPEVEHVLRTYLGGPDELLRAHAVWAAVRLGRVDLVENDERLAADASPLVQAELARCGTRPRQPVHLTGVRATRAPGRGPTSQAAASRAEPAPGD